MIITLQIRPCPCCHLENEIDAAQCHSCGTKFRCARAQVLDVPMNGTAQKCESAGKSEIAPTERSPIKRCLLKLQARKYDISALRFD